LFPPVNQARETSSNLETHDPPGLKSASHKDYL